MSGEFEWRWMKIASSLFLTKLKDVLTSTKTISLNLLDFLQLIKLINCVIVFSLRLEEIQCRFCQNNKQ